MKRRREKKGENSHQKHYDVRNIQLVLSCGVLDSSAGLWSSLFTFIISETKLFYSLSSRRFVRSFFEEINL